jgi:enediyne biosynthesis protein E4
MCLLLLAGVAIGCRKTDPESPPVAPVAPWFEDVTEAMGLDFVHDAGPLDGKFFMPQIVGSGAALFDLDGRGQVGMVLLNNGGPKGRPNQLHRRSPSGKFENISRGSGLDFAGYCMGVAVGDYDNDGLPDILITMVGGVKLFHNEGGGKFLDVTKGAGLDNPAWGASAAFLDFDRDGLLDLVIVNYIDYDSSWNCTSPAGISDYCSPNSFSGRGAQLYRNLGGGKFANVTLPSGLGKTPGPGLGVLCADFDGDGWVDILIANDGKPNHLWINQKNGTFKEEAVLRGVAFDGMGKAQAGMGVAIGDVDGDGLFDLFITHLGAEQHTLWKQGPRGLFRDRSGLAGLSTPHWRATGFGACMADFDNDGAIDIVMVNGRVARGPPAAGDLPGDAHWHGYLERNQVFANDGGGKFRDRSPDEPALCGTPNMGRGLVRYDLDGDGGIDLLVTTAGGRARLFRNVAPERGHWLTVRAVEKTGKRDAYGAEVSVKAGGRAWKRDVRSADSYLCASDPKVHFGLGAAATIEGIEILWPNGVREEFPGGSADRTVVLRQGNGLR